MENKNQTETGQYFDCLQRVGHTYNTILLDFAIVLGENLAASRPRIVVHDRRSGSDLCRTMC